MPKNSKPTVQETFKSIVSADNMNSLNEAIKTVDAHTKKEQTEIINAVEKKVLHDFRGSEHVDAKIIGFAEGVFSLGCKIVGDDVIDSIMNHNNFEFHSILAKADLVFQAKGGDTAPELRELIKAVTKLSDDDYNSATSLTRTFLKVSKEQATLAAHAKRANPFRGRNKPRKPR